MYDFYFDPARQGYDDTIWKTLAGTPAVSGDVLRINQDEIIGYGDIKGGNHIFKVNVPTPSNAALTGGTSATAVADTWASVDDGEFTITIDGTEYDVTGIDFTGVTDMDEVADVIEAALQEKASFIVVEWDTDHFIITGRKSLTVLSAVSEGTGTDISGAGATAYMDSDVGAADESLDAGTDKIFGLYAHNSGYKATFEVRGEKLVMVTKNSKGTTETMLDWDTDLTGEATRFEINLTGRQVNFKINEVSKAIHNDDNYPEGPLSLYALNLADDNLDISYIESRSVESYV